MGQYVKLTCQVRSVAVKKEATLAIWSAPDVMDVDNQRVITL